MWLKWSFQNFIFVSWLLSIYLGQHLWLTLEESMFFLQLFRKALKVTTENVFKERKSWRWSCKRHDHLHFSFHWLFLGLNARYKSKHPAVHVSSQPHGQSWSLWQPGGKDEEETARDAALGPQHLRYVTRLMFSIWLWLLICTWSIAINIYKWNGLTLVFCIILIWNTPAMHLIKVLNMAKLKMYSLPGIKY